MKKIEKKISTRIFWGFNPVSRVKQSKKIYSRKKLKNMDTKID